MFIEIVPSELYDGHFTATFLHEREPIASIVDAPHEIANRWAEAMRDLHGGVAEIRRLGICFYCSSTRRDGEFCLDCDRVFTR